MLHRLGAYLHALFTATEVGTPDTYLLCKATRWTNAAIDEFQEVGKLRV